MHGLPSWLSQDVGKKKLAMFDMITHNVRNYGLLTMDAYKHLKLCNVFISVR